MYTRQSRMQTINQNVGALRQATVVLYSVINQTLSVAGRVTSFPPQSGLAPRYGAGCPVRQWSDSNCGRDDWVTPAGRDAGPGTPSTRATDHWVRQTTGTSLGWTSQGGRWEVWNAIDKKCAVLRGDLKFWLQIGARLPRPRPRAAPPRPGRHLRPHFRH